MEKPLVLDTDAGRDLARRLGVVPRYPRSEPPYRVHWNWELSHQCNYRCSYCRSWEPEPAIGQAFPDIGRWREVWGRIFELYWCGQVRFSGGESTIYPGFWDLVDMLLEMNTVDITTNLSFEIADITRIKDPRGLSLSASFHPEYTEFLPFVTKAHYLKSNGYTSSVSYVAYPPHLSRTEEYKKYTESLGMYFKIIPFSGTYKGAVYPQAYTPEERALIEGLGRNAQDQHSVEMNTRWYDWQIKKQDIPQSKAKAGERCRMGLNYAKIHSDGTVTRCCAGDRGLDSGRLGNILDPDFRLLDEAKPCQVTQNCPCFKAMLVSQDEERWLSLWDGLAHPRYRSEDLLEYLRILKTGSMG